MAFGKKKAKQKFEMLRIRKLADTENASRYTMFDKQTGEKKLVNPDTPGEEHEAYPLLGVKLENTPKHTSISQTLVLQGVQEGWIALENQQNVSRPGGPPDLKWHPSNQHNFVHADSVTFKTVDGDVKYLVTRQPDKYAVKGDDVAVSDEIYAKGDTEVSWFFLLELVEEA